MAHISALLLQFDLDLRLRRLTVRPFDPETQPTKGQGWAAVGFRRTWLSDGLRPERTSALSYGVLTHLESRSSSRIELNEGLLTVSSRTVTYVFAAASSSD